MQASRAQFLSEVEAADFVVVQSRYGFRTVRECGVADNRIFRLHLGVDTDHFRPRVAERRPGPTRVLFVGTIGRRKGVHHLLTAWKAAEVPDAELLFVGNKLSPDAAELIRSVTSCASAGIWDG